jgi:3'-5' exoribonuclease
MDDLDAKVNAFQGYIREARDEESDWTPYHRLLDRYIYKGRMPRDAEGESPVPPPDQPSPEGGDGI